MWDADVARASLLPVKAGLGELREVTVGRADAARLRGGRHVALRGADAQTAGPAYATCGGVVVAVCEAALGELVPGRVFSTPF